MRAHSAYGNQFHCTTHRTSCFHGNRRRTVSASEAISSLLSPTDQEQSQINLHQTQLGLIALGGTEEALRDGHIWMQLNTMIMNSHSDGRTCS